MDVTISTEHYRFLSETAAEHLGGESARAIERADAIFHPGDPLGTLLSEAWRLDPVRASLALTSYMAGLRAECDRREVSPPTLDDVVHGLRYAINTARYPDVDLAALSTALRRDVPGMYGAPI